MNTCIYVFFLTSLIHDKNLITGKQTKNTTSLVFGQVILHVLYGFLKSNCKVRGWFEKFSTKPTTDFKLGTSSCWLGTQRVLVSPPHYECAAAQSMDPWKASHQCGDDTSSCLGAYSTAACCKFHIGCRVGRELSTLLVCCYQSPWSHGL